MSGVLLYNKMDHMTDERYTTWLTIGLTIGLACILACILAGLVCTGAGAGMATG